ncbi:MAG: hypothetical protein AABW56_02350 [Nanoarchaeota archaeon]
MVFNKKRGILYISILILLLVGVYFTSVVDSIGVINRDNRNSLNAINATTEQNGTQPGRCARSNVLSGDSNCNMALYPDLANWTRGGNTEVIVYIINISNRTTSVPGSLMFTANNNVTTINISLPSGYGSLERVAQTSALANASFTGWSLLGQGAGSNWSINTTSNLIHINVTGIGVSNPSMVMGPNGAFESLYISFNVTAINGTEAVYNWTVIVYNASGANMANTVIDNGFGALLGVDGLAPRLARTNVTDGTNTRTSFSGTQYLKYDKTSTHQGVNITISVTDYNVDRVVLIYNSTGGSLNLTAIRNEIYRNVSAKSTFISFDGRNNNTINGNIVENTSAQFTISPALSTRSDVALASAPEYMYKFNFSNLTWGQGVSDGTLFKYVFVVYDLYNNSEIINNSNAEYVLGRDVDVPTATLTAPSDTSISLYQTIRYTCTGTDTSGLASCTTTVTKPGSSTITATGCGTEQSFTGDHTNEPGTYTVQCATVDNVGRSASTSGTFTVSSATSSGGGDSGGGGGGGSSAGSSAENPVTVSEGVTTELGALSTSDTYTSIPASGGISFSISGQSHTAKVLTVTSTSATIEFASTPSQVTLNVGETKEVDLNDNGKMDLSVMLKSITNSKADLIFKTITEVTETPTTPEPTVEPPTTEGSSSTWVWILVIIVVVVLLIWYFSKKNR